MVIIVNDDGATLTLAQCSRWYSTCRNNICVFLFYFIYLTFGEIIVLAVGDGERGWSDAVDDEQT